jgi:hypothetical protein
MKLTDWHHLFGMTLRDFFTDTAFHVELETDLSVKKQLLDVVIIDKRQGMMPDALPDGLENLAVHNLLSFKSWREAFDDWSADELIGHYVNYRKQTSPSLKNLLPSADFHLYAVSMRFPRKLARKAELKNVQAGVYDIRWGVRDIRLIVTNRIERKKRNAAWLMFSAVPENIRYGVTHYSGRLDEMSGTVNQLLLRYRDERIIEMPYTVEDYRRELEKNVLSSITAERVLEEFSLDELLNKIPAEKRLQGIPAEERLKGLSALQIEAYLKKLRKPGA